MKKAKEIKEAVKAIFYSCVITIITLATIIAMFGMGIVMTHYPYQSSTHKESTVYSRSNDIIIAPEHLSLKDKVEYAESIFGKQQLGLIPEYSLYRSSGIKNLRKTHSEVISSKSKVELTDLYSYDKKVSISRGDFKRILITTFPKGWIEEEISGIYQVDSIPPGNGVNGHCSDDDAEGKSKILIFGQSYRYDFNSIINGLLTHEIAHANDWNHDNYMLFEERIDLLLHVWQRVQSDDRYVSAYVESFRNTGQNATMAKEYWAEICKEYFCAGLDKLNIEDIKLIEKVIYQKDPSFDVMAAYQSRAQNIEGLPTWYSKRKDYKRVPWPTQEIEEANNGSH